MSESTLVRDLAVVMVTSGIVTMVFHRLRQPVVLGYILAGVIIGPHTPPFAFVQDGHSIETLAELGVTLLLFVIALLGKQAGVVPDTLYPLTVAVSAVTTLSTPYQIRGTDLLATRLAPLVPARLRALVTFYQRRIRKERSGPSTFSREARGALVRGFVSTTLVVALLSVTDFARRLAAERGMRSLVFPHDVEGLLWTACGLACLPALVGIWNAGGLLARGLLGVQAEGDSSKVLVETVRFGFLVANGALFLALASPILPAGVPLLVAGSVVSLAGVLFWRSLGAVHSRAEALLESMFSGSESNEQGHSVRGRLIEELSAKYPFEVVAEDFVVPFHDTACNRRIRDLGLRQRTGATIAAIFRDEASIVNPDPALELRPGDVLVLLGSADQVAGALRELERLASERLG